MWLKFLVSSYRKSAPRDLQHILKRRKLRPRGTSNLSKVMEEDGRGAGSSPSCVNSQTRASTTSPSLCPAESVCLPPGQSPSPQWKIRIQSKQSCAYFKMRSSAGSGMLAWLWSHRKCQNASWGLCTNPGTNTSAAKAGFREQEAPHLELITTSVYPVSLGEIWQICVGKSG